ncbi:hypothetical protein LCGC14_1791340 [marine sediment metagenome]|uniref:Uncharacterized protein n=1 Tax=marine sediment metagenome TaxID=412755 RepID=A0A0F9GSH6_9ZZZZ
MKIKSFIAPTIREALMSVKREMGDSPLILDTSDIEEGDKVEYKSPCPLTVTVGGFNSPQLFHNALCVPVPFEF